MLLANRRRWWDKGKSAPRFDPRDDVTFALPHADRVYVLEHARIVWEGDPSRFATEAGTGYF